MVYHFRTDLGFIPTPPPQSKALTLCIWTTSASDTIHVVYSGYSSTEAPSVLFFSSPMFVLISAGDTVWVRYTSGTDGTPLKILDRNVLFTGFKI